MAAQKTMLLGVLDVGKTMGESVSSGMGKLTLCQQFLSSFLLQRSMQIKTLEFGLTTYGSDITNNKMAGKQQCIAHVFVSMLHHK